jgi:ferredoxin
VIWGRPAARFDERDTMFARAARRPDTAAYADYYRRHPDRQHDDDRIRELPDLLAPGGRAYDAEVTAQAREWFDRIHAWTAGPEVGPLSARITASRDFGAELRSAALSLGAVAAGCCEVDPMWAYSHKGRFDGDYGREIDAARRRWALVFLVEMDHAEMQGAPGAAAIRESARQYFRAAVIARTIAASLERAGIDAAAHYDAHYELVLPPMAVAAGLGEMGRHNLLVADRFGTRVRIGAVTMAETLRPDGRRALCVEEFCRHCRKCADSCPPRALSAVEPVEVNGVVKWPTDASRCYRYWRLMGSDCGICMAVCPFSHRDSWLHNLVRRLVRVAPALGPALVHADDLLYGRTWKPRRDPVRPRPGRWRASGEPPTGP